MRYRVEIRDVPPAQAAKRLGLTAEQFEAKLPQLLDRGFPPPDQDTGNFDLKAIDRWCDLRHNHLLAAGTMGPRSAADVVSSRLEALRSSSGKDRAALPG